MSPHAQLSGRAVVCTAHLMLLQNPKAMLSPADWLPYLCLVRDWCMEQKSADGVRYYWLPDVDSGWPAGRTH